MPHVAPNGKLRQIGKRLVKLGRKNFGIDKNCGFKTPHVFGGNGQLQLLPSSFEFSLAYLEEFFLHAQDGLDDAGLGT